MENLKTDVVVVAAGLSGLAASLAAAEEGKKVIALEKSNVTGGAVGTDACAIYGDCYPFTFAGNTMAFCLNSGRMAGENASEYIDDLEG